MLTISGVRIENFQSHVNTYIKFSDGLNVITGPSDQGKSAVIRAIKWVLYNEPRGTDFIRHGSNFARVSVELSSGYTVTRERSSSRNRYIVTTPDGESSIYEGFGNDVPAEVIKAHGIPKVMLDTDTDASLNIGEQLEGPFLLSQPGSLRAKAIGRLTGLHIIDRAMRDSLVDMRREGQQLERMKAELEETDARLKEFGSLEDAGKRLNSSEKYIEQLEAMTGRLDKLSKILSSYRETVDELLALETLLKSLEQLHECELLLKDAGYAAVRLKSLEQLQAKLDYAQGETGRVMPVIASTAGLDECGLTISMLSENIKRCGLLTQLSDSLKAVTAGEKLESMKSQKLSRLPEVLELLKGAEQTVSKLEKLEKTALLYKTVENGINEGARYIDANSAELAGLREAYSELLKKAGRCPLCGSSIKTDSVEELMRHWEA